MSNKYLLYGRAYAQETKEAMSEAKRRSIYSVIPPLSRSSAEAPHTTMADLPESGAPKFDEKGRETSETAAPKTPEPAPEAAKEEPPVLFTKSHPIFAPGGTTGVVQQLTSPEEGAKNVS